jgi:hypothetical protein
MRWEARARLGAGEAFARESRAQVEGKAEAEKAVREDPERSEKQADVHGGEDRWDL